MKRILIALAGYALYRWWTKPEQQLTEVLPPPRNATNPQRKSAAR